MSVLTQSLIKKLEDQKYALDQAAIVATTDANGIITYVNDKFCEISGYSREELLGKTHKVVNSGVHTKLFFKDLWSVISSGQVWRGEVCNRGKHGNIYWVHTTIVPFLDENQKSVQYLAIRYDITDLKSAQQTIFEQQEKLIVASRLSAIGEMAAAITHEINNPLGVILGRVEMLKSILTDGQFKTQELLDIADTIEVTGMRIAKIVRSMKTMAHHNQDQDNSESVAVSSLLNDAADLCFHRFEASRVRLLKPEISAALSVDCRSHQIVQVLINLLSNSYDAVQHLPERWIKIEVIDHATDVEISITDSGARIPKDTQNKMFSPFFSTKGVLYGTGLGLSISQGILRQHGGSLEYDNHAKHTRFVITLLKKTPQLKKTLNEAIRPA